MTSRTGNNLHTPGPWLLSETGTTLGVTTDYHGSICRMAISPLSQQADIGRANARLIAAAPDLLEALHDLVETVDCPRYGDDRLIGDLYSEGGFSSVADRSVMDVARAAIAKATRLPSDGSS